MTFDPDSLALYPIEPGVYLMKDHKDRIIYIGKAKNLRQRLKQYFIPGRDKRAMIPLLIEKITAIDTIIVPDEKQALLLENTLIKKHKPHYNVLLKDDKTYISLMINNDHPWPKISIVRCFGKQPKKGLYFGPYTSAYSARQVFDLMARIFPLRQCSDEELARRTRPCVLYAIKRCIAPCTNKCTKEEYHSLVDNAIKFLKGQDKYVLKELYREMEEASDKLEFERAASLLRTIRQIEAITQSRQLTVHSSSPHCDIFGIYREGDECTLSQLFIREGKLSGSKHYNFSDLLADDSELLESFLLQHYDLEIPPEIILPHSLENSELITEILSERASKNIALLIPQKGEKKKLVKLAEDNARSIFTREKDHKEIKEHLLLEMQETLKLTRFPRRIECFDISNISGTNPVGSMVAFTEGEKDKKRYRLFKIKDIAPGDDYKAMHEMITRRLIRAKEEEDLPDLIIVDGGKGHLNIVLEIFKELDIASVDAISLAKEKALHTKGMTQERVFIPDQKDPISFDPRSPLLFFLQTIRDESHRTALAFHKKRRTKETIKTSLETIPGIGPTKTKRLLTHFGSLKRIKEATAAELAQVKGLTQKDIAALLDFSKKA
jgi:excinuclease ABC subunit C